MTYEEEQQQAAYRAKNRYRKARQKSDGAIIFVDDVTFDVERHEELPPDEAAVQ